MTRSAKGTTVRRWEYAWIAALFVLGVTGLLRWVVFSSYGAAAGIVNGIQIAAVVVGIVAIFRWAVLRERDRDQSRTKGVSQRE
jgi:cytochrome c biogenesis protein CcdA